MIAKSVRRRIYPSMLARPPMAGQVMAAAASRYGATVTLAERVRLHSVRVPSSPGLILHRLTAVASAASASGSEPAAAISGVVPATRMITRPLYTPLQQATRSSVSCVVRACPLPFPSNDVVLTFTFFK
jgi:hypothetical protein